MMDMGQATRWRGLYRITDVSRQVLVSEYFTDLCPPPPDPWFERGPRGGLYLATGPRARFVDESARWDMNLVRVIDSSEDSKYVRPHTRLAASAIT